MQGFLSIILRKVHIRYLYHSLFQGKKPCSNILTLHLPLHDLTLFDRYYLFPAVIAPTIDKISSDVNVFASPQMA